MIKSIKDLMKISETIEQINTKLENQSKKLDSFSNDLFLFKNTFDAKIKEITDKQEKSIEKFDQEIKEIKSLKQEFANEIADIKVQKTLTLKKVMETTSDDFKSQLDRVKSDVQRFNELKSQLSSMSESITQSKEEMNKFIQISKNIKAEDYELTKFANKILANDKEKLELMAKIDSLERLLSKERRTRN